jgi:hypothetical protein
VITASLPARSYLAGWLAGWLADNPRLGQSWTWTLSRARQEAMDPLLQLSPHYNGIMSMICGLVENISNQWLLISWMAGGILFACCWEDS